MPVLEASALNDNDETLAFLRAILAPTGASAGDAREHRVGLRESRVVAKTGGQRHIEVWTPEAQDRPSLRVPTIIGAVVSIRTSRRFKTRLGSCLRPVPRLFKGRARVPTRALRPSRCLKGLGPVRAG